MLWIIKSTLSSALVVKPKMTELLAGDCPYAQAMLEKVPNVRVLGVCQITDDQFLRVLMVDNPMPLLEELTVMCNRRVTAPHIPNSFHHLLVNNAQFRLVTVPKKEVELYRQ